MDSLDKLTLIKQLLKKLTFEPDAISNLLNNASTKRVIHFAWFIQKVSHVYWRWDIPIHSDLNWNSWNIFRFTTSIIKPLYHFATRRKKKGDDLLSFNSLWILISLIRRSSIHQNGHILRRNTQVIIHTTHFQNQLKESNIPFYTFFYEIYHLISLFKEK